MSEKKGAMAIELPESVAGVQHRASLRSTLNGQVQEFGFTEEDLKLIADGSVRTAKTIVRGSDEVDVLFGYNIVRTEEDRDVYRFRYQRPTHIAEIRNGNYYGRKETLRVGSIIEGMLRDEGGRASEIVLFDVRKYS